MNLSADFELSIQDIEKIIVREQTELAKLTRLRKYYEGTHNILYKYNEDTSKPCNKLVFNFPKYITDNYTSYMVGNPITYSCADEDLMIELQYAMDVNDAQKVDSRICRNMNTTGYAYELHYVDANGMMRFCSIAPEDGIVVYDDTLEQNILYFIRLVKNYDIDGNLTYTVEVYDKQMCRRFKANSLMSELHPIGQNFHYYGKVPVVVYHDKSCFEDVISLVDAYEKLASAETDDYEAFVDSYMVLKGMTADKDDIAQMKENRVLLLDGDADASYLIKQSDTTQIQNIKQDLITNIHKISACPDFADQSFGTASGIAMKYKLLGFTNVSGGKLRVLRNGIMRRIELICGILNLKGCQFDFTTVRPIFTPNLPVDIDGIVNEVNALRGLVSDETLIAQLPFVENVPAELEKLNEQNANTYNFDTQPETW